MAVTSEIDKLRILLPHWISHSDNHKSEFVKWAATARNEGLEDVAVLIEQAIDKINETETTLTHALEKIGGPLADQGHHH